MNDAPQSHTSKSIFRNVLYGLSTWILPLALSFVAMPTIIRSLGDKDYGIYALVLGFIAYSFNLNFGRAITKYIAEYRTRNEAEKIRDVISATFFINVSLGIVVILVIFLTANYLVTDVFQIEAADQNKTVWALYISALTLFCLMLNQVFSSILQGIHRFDVYSNITNFNNIATILGNLLLVWQGFGLNALLGWNLLTTFLSFLFFIFGAIKYLPEFGIAFRFQKETIKTVLKFSSGVIGYQILANLFILFERGWIIRKLGAESLTFYVVPMSLSLYIHSFISSIVLVIFPLASELRNDREKLLRLYTKATKVVCFFVIFIAASLILHSRDFLTLWLGEEFANKADLLLIFHVITFSLLAIQTITWQMTEGLGYPQFNTLIYGICLAINLILMLILTGKYENDGIAFARTVGFTVIFFSLFYVEKWFFGKIQFKFWIKILALLGTATAVSILFQEFIIYEFPVKWIWLLVSIGGGGLIYCAILFVLGYISADEKLLIKNLLKK